MACVYNKQFASRKYVITFKPTFGQGELTSGIISAESFEDAKKQFHEYFDDRIYTIMTTERMGDSYSGISFEDKLKAYNDNTNDAYKVCKFWE